MPARGKAAMAEAAGHDRIAVGVLRLCGAYVNSLIKMHVETAVQNADSEEPRQYYGKPGRLAPRWIEDLYAGALADSDGEFGDLFMSCEALPGRLTLPQSSLEAPSQSQDGSRARDRQLSHGNGHEFLLTETQTVDNETNEVISCMCKHCKYHFVFRFKRKAGQYCGRGLGGDLPFCHLVQTDSEFPSFDEERDKWFPCTHTVRWLCSATHCSAQVTVSVLRPRMNPEHVRWIVDEERIRRQRQEALAQDPERFANLNENLEKMSLVTLNAYLRDSLVQSASAERKKVATRNKVFVVQFGQPSLPIFQYLGFDINIIDEDEYLMLPQPPAYPGHTPIGSVRAFYEDARSEILALIDETGREQVRVQNTPARARLERALMCYNHNSRPGHALQVPRDEAAAFEALGATADSGDGLLEFAFLCQTKTDPARMRNYCAALQGLASSRSHDLQIFAATQASLEDAAPRETSRDPLVNAYAHLGLSPDGYQDDDTVIREYILLRSQAPEQNDKHRQMLFLIGKSRQSRGIKDIACDIPDFKEACQFLDVENLGDQSSSDVLMSYIESQVRDGKEPLLVAAAMETIANHIGSADMKQKAQFFRQLGDQGAEPATADVSSGDGDEVTNLNLPLGLDNLRNTCYLNSILQYFFTVKAVRDVVLKFDPDKVACDEATRANAEVYLGREFVLELKKLFSELDSAPNRFVKPQQRLANAAWISVDKVEKDKEKASVAGFSASAGAPEEKPLPPPRPLPNRPVPPIPSQQPTTQVTVTVDSVPEQAEDAIMSASVSSSQTLTNQIEVSSDMSSEGFGHEDAVGKMTGEPTEVRQPNSPGTTPVTMVQARTAGGGGGSQAPEENVKCADRSDANTLIGALEDALAQTEIKGTEQMDVEEVMGRCINHLRVAINPASVVSGSENSEHRDDIMVNLYITFANLRKEKDAPRYSRNTSQERWVTANPASDGPLSLYDALDGYFERELIGNRLVSFTSIVTAPPIFHICIQRSQVGGGKNTNPVIIPEVLYLDRYMESDEGSQLFQARKRGWDIKSQLRDLQHAPGAGAGAGTAGTAGTAGIAGTADGALDVFMRQRSATPRDAGAERDVEDFFMVDPSIKDVLDRHGKPLGRALTSGTPPGLTDSSDEEDGMEWPSVEAMEALDDMATAQREGLRRELDGLFADMKTHKYCLHSVICHAGQTAKSGHYWVWIFDFEQNIWRKYNDRNVTESADTGAVLAELSTRGEPYYVMYVRDEDKNDLVSIPRLKRHVGSTPEDVEMADTVMASAEHMETAPGEPPSYAA